MTEVLVLCYHAVSPRWDGILAISPEALERQLSFFLRRGWQPSTFTEAILDPPAPRTLAVTFDDAFASVNALAAPILDRLGVVATAFAPTSHVTSGEPLAWSGLEHWLDTPHAGELTPMTWDELGALAERGWEIGSHTCTHPDLLSMDDEAVRKELGHSRLDTEQRIGRPCRAVAYPYGHVDDRVAALAREAGYATGASLARRERPDPLRAPRVGVYHHDMWWRFRLKSARPMRSTRTVRAAS
jgi:peptidoglycan/xylan/chitin deacetylase (PgdA/CDA1 family)